MADLSVDPASLKALIQAGITDDTYAPIPVDQWGADHYSTFLYLETCAVDASGSIRVDPMRSDPALHPQFCRLSSFDSPNEYPTIAKHGVKIDNHDDWYCLADIVCSGFATYQLSTKGGGTIRLTPLGWEWAGKIRRNRAEGKLDKDFDPAYWGLL